MSHQHAVTRVRRVVVIAASLLLVALGLSSPASAATPTPTLVASAVTSTITPPCGPPACSVPPTLAVIGTPFTLTVTLTAGWQKIFSADPKIGFLSHAAKYTEGIANGVLVAPAKTPEAMSRIVFNDRLDAALCALFIFVVLSVLVYSIKACIAARAANRPTTQETPFEPMGAAAATPAH